MEADATLRALLTTLGFAEDAPIDDAARSRTLRAPHAAPGVPASLPRIAVRRGDRDEPPGSEPPPDLEVAGLLGRGGMGEVLLARQRSLGREVAVKVALDENPEARDALIAEAVVVGALEHPNIVPVHALGLDGDGLPLLVMKRVQGVSWLELLDAPEHPWWSRLPSRPSDRLGAHIELLMQVCLAVHFAHSRGYLHRDIKPENVLVGEFGEVYLVDWGLAVRVDEQGVAASDTALQGTPGCLAPEMIDRAHGPIDARTDVYLLGATLHRVLTGAMRHEGPTIAMVLLSAMRSEPFEYEPSVPADLAALANRATHPSADARPQSALAFRQALGDFLRHRGAAQLTRSSIERLAEATALDPQGDDAARSTLLTEARFGLTQALREWPESAAALDALDECLRAIFRHELARENPAGARAALTEIRSDSSELQRDLDALERRVAARREVETQLQALLHEEDLSVGAGTRGRILAAVVALGVAIPLVISWLRPGGTLSGRDLVLFAAFVTSVVLLAGWLGRRGGLANAMSRRLYFGLATMTVLSLLWRLDGVATSRPVADTFRGDLTLLAAEGAIATVAITRAVWWMPAIASVGWLLALRWPAQSDAIYQWSTTAITWVALGLSVGPWARGTSSDRG